MRTFASLLACSALAGCIEPVAERWQLDHDHVIAARSSPPRIEPGQTAVLDALVARSGTFATVEAPTFAAAPLAPAELGGMVAHDANGAWVVTAPEAEQLRASRPAMGLADDAPIPVEVVMTFARPSGGDYYVKKTVWLGERAEQPVIPALSFDEAPAGESLELPRDRDVYVELAVPSNIRVNWLTSCGTLFQDDVARAFLRVAPDDEPCEGQLAVVVRDDEGGVAWQLWPLRVP